MFYSFFFEDSDLEVGESLTHDPARAIGGTMRRELTWASCVLGVACSSVATRAPDSGNTPTGDEPITFPVFVFDPSNPNDPPCFVWTEVSGPARYWSDYSESISGTSGYCAFAEMLLDYENADGLCYRIPGDCGVDSTRPAMGQAARLHLGAMKAATTSASYRPPPCSTAHTTTSPP